MNPSFSPWRIQIAVFAFQCVALFLLAQGIAISQVMPDETTALSDAIWSMATTQVKERGTFETKEDYQARLPTWDSTRVWTIYLDCAPSYSIDDSVLTLTVKGFESDSRSPYFYGAKYATCNTTQKRLGVHTAKGKPYVATTTKGKKIKIAVKNYYWSIISQLDLCHAKAVVTFSPRVTADFIEQIGPERDYSSDVEDEMNIVLSFKMAPDVVKPFYNSIGAYIRCKVSGYQSLEVDEEEFGATVKNPEDLKITKYILKAEVVDGAIIDRKQDRIIAGIKYVAAEKSRR